MFVAIRSALKKIRAENLLQMEFSAYLGMLYMLSLRSKAFCFSFCCWKMLHVAPCKNLPSFDVVKAPTGFMRDLVIGNLVIVSCAVAATCSLSFEHRMVFADSIDVYLFLLPLWLIYKVSYNHFASISLLLESWLFINFQVTSLLTSNIFCANATRIIVSMIFRDVIGFVCEGKVCRPSPTKICKQFPVLSHLPDLLTEHCERCYHN